MENFTNEQMYLIDFDDDYEFHVTQNFKDTPVGPMMQPVYRSLEERQYALDHLFDEDPVPYVPIRALDYNHEAVVNVPGHELSDRGAVVSHTDCFVVDMGFQSLEIPEIAVRAYYASGLHTNTPDIDRYNAFILTGVAPEIKPPVMQSSDGQLKILTDFVIGVDHMVARESKDAYLILVIGSASESGISGVAYRVLTKMKIKCEIHLYDPCERENDFVEGDVHYVYHRGLWNYDDDISCFDIVFDDAYIVGADTKLSMRDQLDPNKRVLTARDYSIKCLTVDVHYFFGYNLFRQAAKTPSDEHRCVKHKRYYGLYRPLFEGKCAFCTQMKYLLRRDYEWDFFEYVLRAHKRPCVLGFRVFPRQVCVQNDCCLRTKSTLPNRLLICAHHSSYIGLYPLQRLSPDRRLYSPQLPYDFEKMEFWDVVIESQNVGHNVVVSGEKLIFLVARSLVIRHQGQYFVSSLLKNEHTHASKVNFRYVIPTRIKIKNNNI